MSPARVLQRLRAEVGLLGMVSLVLIVCGVSFQAAVLQPLEARRNALEQRVSQGLAQSRSGQSDAAPGSSLPRFYRHFESGEDAPTQLARLHGIGKAAGLDLRSAQYRVDKGGPRILRYEITLPLNGTYAQIRTFLTNALAEIPVLSLDQVSLKKDRSDGPVLADVRMTLHLLQP